MKYLTLLFSLLYLSATAQTDTLESFDDNGNGSIHHVKKPKLHKRTKLNAVLYPAESLAPAPVDLTGCKVKTVWSTSQSQIWLTIAGDGYTYSDSSKFFNTDVPAFVNALKNDAAYGPNINYFGIKAMFCPSGQAGASGVECYTGGTAVVVSNRYGSKFNYGGTCRLLYITNGSQLSADLQGLTPGYFKALVIVNSPYYGGGGGGYAVFSTHSSSAEIGLHEFAHSFAGLADEYGGGNCSNTGKPNAWNGVGTCPWSAMEKAGEVYPTPANTFCSDGYAHRYCGANYCNSCPGTSPGFYRPFCTCKMRTLFKPFCKVCQKAISDKVQSMVTVQPPVVTITPGTATIEAGQSITLTAAGATTYIWRSGATIIGTTAAVTVSPVITTTYSVAGTKNGLSDTASVIVTVTDPPAACELNASFTYDGICKCVKWKLYKTGCGLKYTYSRKVGTGWTTPYTVDFTNTAASSKSGSISGSWIVPGTYTYRVTCVSNGCFKDYNVTVP